MIVSSRERTDNNTIISIAGIYYPQRSTPKYIYLVDVPFSWRSLRSALLMASYECRHALRTPLMCAVQTANFAIFTTIMHAFNRLFTAKVSTGKRTDQ